MTADLGLRESPLQLDALRAQSASSAKVILSGTVNVATSGRSE